jgi:hypothetical protein
MARHLAATTHGSQNSSLVFILTRIGMPIYRLDFNSKCAAL